MPDGSTMGAAAHPPAADVTELCPSPAEKMICAAETHTTIQKVLGLTSTPTSAATWRDHLYTCTYRLPMGTLIVSVKQSANPAPPRPTSTPTGPRSAPPKRSTASAKAPTAPRPAPSC